LNHTQSTESFEILISSRAAADLVGLHYKTLERMARTHQVPATKIGRSWIFKTSVLNRWLDGLLTANMVEFPTKQSTTGK
jgi:excisionase family DNA binding protein